MINEFITSSLGLKLRTRKWEINHPKADIFFVHGFAEHCLRYDNEAQYFNSLGFNFYSYDQRTHGESAGNPRAYICDFKNYVTEYSDFLNANNSGTNRAFFLMSHSMGGLVQLSYLLQNKNRHANYKGSLFSSPFLMPNKDMAPLLQKLSGIVARLAPKLKTVKIKKEDISRDPKEQESYFSDPLNYIGGVYAQSAFSLLNQMKKIGPLFSTFDDTFIVQHGTDDHLAEIEGSKNLFEKSSSSDKSYFPLEQFRHEITRDLGFEKVLERYGKWMLKRI